MADAKIHGQYTIQNADTNELAIEADNVQGESITISVPTTSNDMYIGTNSNMDNTNGFLLPKGTDVEIFLKNFNYGGDRDIYVYGAAGDTLYWIVHE